MLNTGRLVTNLYVNYILNSSQSQVGLGLGPITEFLKVV